MRHSVEWLDDAVNAAPEEKAAVGDLRLFLNDRNVTIHVLDGSLGDHVTVALYGLVHGLVHDWWTIFGARDHEFSLRKYRTGYLLPDVRFSFDGSIFEVSAHECAYSNPDLRFFGGTSECLSRSDGEAWLRNLIEDVLSRLNDRGLPETSAALRWKRIQASRTRLERTFCEAAGSLSLDPYQIADATADFIERAETVFTAESLIEFVSGSEEVDQSKLIDWVDQMRGFKGFRYRLADLRPMVDNVEKSLPKKKGEAAWAAGYRRARAMRRELGLQQSDRFTSFRELASRLGAPSGYNLAPKVDGINALRREAPDGIHVHVRDHGDAPIAKSSHLFSLARAVGDAACFPAPEISPINRLQNAFRQAAGRAFAAEFLAPVDEIISMQHDERDLYSIADEFGVSPTLIQHQVENFSRISEACT